MKCESCTLRDVEAEVIEYDGQAPYRLCFPCRDRLLSRALRPLEFFNLTAIHGHGESLRAYLHDDYYDYNTGEATQPYTPVVDADKFPFPSFAVIKDNLNKLIDFAIVQYFIEDYVIEQLLTFNKIDILQRINEKLQYNRAIQYNAYKIIANVLGSVGRDWIKNEWTHRREGEILIFAEAITKCLEFDEAFELLTQEIECGSDSLLSNNINALLYFQSDSTLGWIEKVSRRIINVTTSWGQLVASSGFSWNKANQWLTFGRPLSLIALDALYYGTSSAHRENQSLWLRQINPKLPDLPKPEILTHRLLEYLLVDRVPRTENTVQAIISNLAKT